MLQRCRLPDQKKVRKGRKVRRSSKQKRKYSGKKKRHTHKAQVVVRAGSLQIVCLSFSAGSCHDFKLYKKSGLRPPAFTKVRTDSGYQGINKLHANSELPKKNTKKHKLTKEQKAQNRALARHRIYNEHVIGKLKFFNMLQSRYRSHRHFQKRFTLISTFYNANLTM